MKTLITVFCFIFVAQAATWSHVKHKVVAKPNSVYTTQNNHIIGGTVSERHQFPYHVAIYIDITVFCSGSLISDTVVLTSGACVFRGETFEVHLGAQNIFDPSEPDRFVATTTNSKLHEDFSRPFFENDIAVVFLTSPVSGFGFSPIRLPSRSMESQTFTGQVGRITGWGKISQEEPNISSELLYVDATIIPNIICSNTYGSLFINESNVCISTQSGSVGPCGGDTGGPMVIYETDGEATQIGIVSHWSPNGCDSSDPAVFTRVTSYLDWLEIMPGVEIRP